MKLTCIYFVCLILFLNSNTNAQQSSIYDSAVPECSSQIYCNGEILHVVQMANVYPDSKTFVDKKLLYPESEIISKFNVLKNSSNSPLTVSQLTTFIEENFADDELIPWTPTDIKNVPSLVNYISDRRFRKWILELNQIWRDLGQKIDEDVRINPDRHSMLYLPNGFIKAGGRFAEMYYWDSYWIIRGLLLSDMAETARGIIENMISLIKSIGHMPNGSRKYYTQRSQPPLLIQMASTYYSCSKNISFIRDNLQHFETEFQYWYKNRMTNVTKDGKTYQLALYNVISCTPRPESYYEDYETASNYTNYEDKCRIYSGLKSAAETGWDFSSRHMITSNGTNQGSLVDLRPADLIYVDLNSIMHANAVVLGEWFRMFGDETKSSYYKGIANNLLLAIDKVLWNEEVGMWLDYDIRNKKSRIYFYASNLTPLWTSSYYKNKNYASKALAYLYKNKIITYNGKPVYYGVPTSTYNSTQQWDLPNCWAPLQAIVIQGLERTNDPTASKVAFSLAKNWIKTMYAGYVNSGMMYEKYSATELGETGDGGEYTPQTGFGWTNGYCMEIFRKYGKILTSDDIEATNTNFTTTESLDISPDLVKTEK